MNILDKALGVVGLLRKSASYTTNLTTDALSVWLNETKVSDSRALGVFNNWVYACIKAIAEEIGRTQFILMEVKSDGDSAKDEHPLLDLLAAVNTRQTGFELLYTIACHLEATGNAYIVLDGVESEGQTPTALHLLPPDRVKMNIGALGVEEYVFSNGNSTKTFYPYQILHIKYPNPRDQYKGIGTVQAIADWIDADNYATEFNRKFFKNGAHIGGFLKSDSAWTAEQLEYLQKSFEGIYKGVDNAYKTAALPKGTEFTPAQQSQKEMDFTEGQRLTRDKILAGFRVPHIVLGLGAGESLNRATADAAHYVFMSRTIKPKMQLICDYLNEFLVPLFGENIYLTFVDPVPDNREGLMAEMTAAVGGQPVMSVNEARERYFNAPPIQNGDAVMTSFSTIPLGKPEEKAHAAKQKTGGGKPTHRKTKHARAATKRKEIAEELAAKTAEVLEKHKEKLAKIATKSITDLSHEEYDALHKNFVVRVEPYAKLLGAKVRQHNDNVFAEIEESLAEIVKAEKQPQLFDLEKANEALKKLAAPVLNDLFNKEANAAANLLDGKAVKEITPFKKSDDDELDDYLTPEARKALEKFYGLFADHYNKTTALLLKDTIAEGLAEGESLSQLVDRVSTIRGFSDEARAELVARTESFRIANFATRESWNQSGVVKSLKWYTADSEACAFCDELDGKIVDIEENFLELGDTLTANNGQSLDISYADVSGGALHPNCRCYIRPEEIEV
jgi:HK97 family phage portal protein